MAEWYGTARTNYVEFESEAAFKEVRDYVEQFDIAMSTHHEVSLAAMFNASDMSDSGGFPNDRYDEDEDDFVEFDWGYVAQRMAEGHVLVIMEAGAEKLRYISGWAQAWNKEGQHVGISLDDIYEKARAAFGIYPTVATYQNLTK